MYANGEGYKDGEGVVRDDKEAVAWWKRAVDIVEIERRQEVFHNELYKIPRQKDNLSPSVLDFPPLSLCENKSERK